jgi:dipeptidyl aminopeptidase/acylaminoacyl peptidase
MKEEVKMNIQTWDSLKLSLAPAVVLAVLFLAAFPAFGELPPLIPREVLFGNPVKSQAQISPNGKILAYLAPDEKGIMNVCVRTLGQNDDRVVTADQKRGINVYDWQQDSEHILYGQDRDGDENFHVYQTNLKTKITRDLTPFQGVQARRPITDPNFPDQILVALNIRDRRRHDMYRINLKNGAVELDTECLGDQSEFFADNKFQVRAAKVWLPDGGTEIRVRDDAKSPWRSFQKWGLEDSVIIKGFTLDDRGIYLASSVDANVLRLLDVDLDTGKSVVLAEDRQFDIGPILSHPKTHKLEAVMFIRERREWTVFDKSLQADFDTLGKVRDGDLSINSRDLEDNTWIVNYNLADAPVATYAYDRTGKKATFLFNNRPALEKYKLAQMQPISFTARDGMTIYGYLTLPVGLEPKNLPMVLLVHGGPWFRDVWGLNNEVQWLANRGYAVLQINFRGSEGYGKNYLNAGNREWGGKMNDDLIDGKSWAVKQGYADPNQVGIMGMSYGGYATLVGLAFTPDEFACGVDIVGISNLITWLTPLKPFKAWQKRTWGDIETEQEFLKSRSPLFKAEQIKAPLLIGHGANDPRVKQAESDQIVEAMRKNGKPVEYIVFPDEGHGFARPENRMKFYAAAEVFLAKYLGGRAEPPSEKENVDDLRR